MTAKQGEGWLLQHSSQISFEAGGKSGPASSPLLQSLHHPCGLTITLQSNKKESNAHFSHHCFLGSLLHVATETVVLAQGAGVRRQDEAGLLLLLQHWLIPS